MKDNTFPEKNPIISFIIPVYNAELYIEECLNSIIEQKKFCDCEVICVDDKSTDRSCEIIAEYEKRHPNLHLIHHDTNKKAGGARNTGIKASRGQYIWFVDSDDTIASGSLEKIVARLKENSLDVFCFNYSLKYEDTKQICIVFKESPIKSGYQFIENQWGGAIIFYLGYPVIAVFKKSIVTENNNISFIENTTYGEDTTFITEVIAESTRVASTAESLYYYRQGHTSSTSLLMKSWKGTQIYESIFVAGNIVVNNLIERHRGRNPELCSNIECGMPWFVNRLFFRLLRSSLSERKNFYRNNMNSESIDSVIKYMNALNRFIVIHPVIGCCMMCVLSPIYKLYSALKKRILCSSAL